eukprot:6212220-Pleurochrysis_carterae.AAC.5
MERGTMDAESITTPANKLGSNLRRASSFGRYGGGGEKCTRCGKTVYAAERTAAQSHTSDDGSQVVAFPCKLPSPKAFGKNDIFF